MALRSLSCVNRALVVLLFAFLIIAGMMPAVASAMPPVAAMAATPAADGFVSKAEFAGMVFGVKSLTTLTAPNATIELIEPGGYALLPDDGTYTHYVYTGKARITFNSLPIQSSLDLFHETGEAAPDAPITLELAGFYAKCGGSAGMGAFGEGIPMIVDANDPPAFTDALWQIYVQSWSDAFPYEMTEEEMMAAMKGGGMPKPASLVRNPNPDEFFLALITTDGKRFDYTVDGEGTVRITNYAGGLSWYEHPYAVIEEDFDASMDFISKSLTYNYNPETQATSLTILCTAVPTAKLSSYTVSCYPWLEVKYVEVDGVQVPFKRGEFKGAPTWAIEIQSPFEKDRQYQLYFEFTGSAPESYDGIGYGGVYRFDDYALYTAADACDKSIYVEMPEGTEWSFIDSPGGTTDVDDPYTRSTSWSNSSRGVMMVSTQFPMREFESYGVTLEVYAPSDIIGGIGENPAVAQLGQMLNFFSESFGVYSAVYPGGVITRQPLFIIPDEGGVAAFENAGLLFYLGNDHNLPLVAHEVSHIWWGQMVDGPTWFVEGMANYCPIAFFEQYDPPQAVNYRRYIVQAAAAGGSPIGVERLQELGDTGALYQHAAAMWVTMDSIYGKDIFLSALKTLNKTHCDTAALDANVIFGDLGAAMGVDLTSFRRLFFDTTTAPAFSAKLARRGAKPVLVIERVDGADLKIPVTVSVKFAGGSAPELFTIVTEGGVTAGGRDDYIDVENATVNIASDELKDYVQECIIDPENRLLINTPERRNYETFLGWLIPAWTKRGSGDTEGAIYCFEQALKIRSWARDYNDLASLYFGAGRVDEARAMTAEMLAAADAGGVFRGHEIEPKTLCQIHWLAGKIAERDGKTDEAKAHFEKVIELGNVAGLYNLVKSAEEKLGIVHEETEAGAGGMPAGMGMG